GPGPTGPGRVCTWGGGKKSGRKAAWGAGRVGRTWRRTGTREPNAHSQMPSSAARASGRRASPPSTRLTHTRQIRVMQISWFRVWIATSQRSVSVPAARPHLSVSGPEATVLVHKSVLSTHPRPGGPGGECSKYPGIIMEDGAPPRQLKRRSGGGTTPKPGAAHPRPCRLKHSSPFQERA